MPKLRSEEIAGEQAFIRNRIRGTAAKDQLTALLKRYMKNKVYISKATQKEAKTHYDTLSAIWGKGK